MTHKYKSLLISMEEVNNFGLEILQKLINLRDLTDYQVDPCLYNHGKRCSQCGITELFEDMQDIGYWDSDVPFFRQRYHSKWAILHSLYKIEAKMEKRKAKVYAYCRKPNQYFPNETTIINDLILEV